MSFVRFQKEVKLYVKNYHLLGVDHARAQITSEMNMSNLTIGTPLILSDYFLPMRVLFMQK